MRALLAGIALTAVAAPLAAQGSGADSATVERATVAARLWLTLVDQLDYADSWSDAHEAFRGAVTEEQWVAQMRRIRMPLGEVDEREPLSAEYTTELPNAPPGEYVVIRFRTDFARLAGAVETVVPMKSEDGTWRVSGYFIRPPN